MRVWRPAALAALLLSSLSHSVSAAEPVPGAWVKGLNVETRLIAGHRPLPDGTLQPTAGVEMRLADGWKTYWRQPGDAGGLPPSFDWSGSENMGAARVLFPAPERLADPSGETIGYKRAVVLPVEITPKDPARPVVLRLSIEFGVCREICVPAEARLAATIEPSTLPQLPPPLASALARVPRDAAMRRPGDPQLKSAKANLAGARPTLTFDIAGDAAAADLFVEAPDGIMLPMARRIAAPEAGVIRYEIAVPPGDDLKALPGKTLVLTMVGAKASAETRWVVK